MVGEDARQRTHYSTGDHDAVQLGLLILVVEGKERSETRHPQEIQVTEIKDQRSLQLRKAADCLGYRIYIRRIDFATDAQDRGQTARVNLEPHPSAIDQIPAAGLFASLRCV